MPFVQYQQRTKISSHDESDKNLYVQVPISQDSAKDVGSTAIVFLGLNDSEHIEREKINRAIRFLPHELKPTLYSTQQNELTKDSESIPDYDDPKILFEQVKTFEPDKALNEEEQASFHQQLTILLLALHPRARVVVIALLHQFVQASQKHHHIIYIESAHGDGISIYGGLTANHAIPLELKLAFFKLFPSVTGKIKHLFLGECFSGYKHSFSLYQKTFKSLTSMVGFPYFSPLAQSGSAIMMANYISFLQQNKNIKELNAKVLLPNIDQSALGQSFSIQTVIDKEVLYHDYYNPKQNSQKAWIQYKQDRASIIQALKSKEDQSHQNLAYFVSNVRYLYDAIKGDSEFRKTLTLYDIEDISSVYWNMREQRSASRKEEMKEDDTIYKTTFTIYKHTPNGKILPQSATISELFLLSHQ